jgi:hypothetical protein
VGDSALEAGLCSVLLVEVQGVGIPARGRERRDVVVGQRLREGDPVTDAQEFA